MMKNDNSANLYQKCLILLHFFLEFYVIHLKSHEVKIDHSGTLTLTDNFECKDVMVFDLPMIF